MRKLVIWAAFFSLDYITKKIQLFLAICKVRFSYLLSEVVNTVPQQKFFVA